MARYSLTLQQAWSKVALYEEQNADLRPEVQRMLAVFAIARASTRDVIAQIVGHDASWPFRDHSRRWWVVLSHSGLVEYWDGFRSRGQNEGLTAASRWLRGEVTTEQWTLFERRAGVGIGFQLWNRSTKPKGDVIWDRSGCWVEEYRRIGDDMPRWSVFDVEGRWLGLLTGPERFRVSDIGADYVLGIATDDMDVEQARMYRLVKP